MAKKYVKDYRLNETVDERGRIRSNAEYIGGSYYLKRDSAAVRTRAWILTAACAVSWICWLVPMLFNNGSMHIAFISYPYIFIALTLWLRSMALYTALTLTQPMKRKESDRLTNWLPGTSIATIVLSGVVLIGMGVSLVFNIGTRNSYDWLVLAGDLVLLAGSIFTLTQRAFFRTEER